MTDFTEYFLNSGVSVVQLDLLEISHPAFSQTYRLVRNAVQGVTVTLETSAEETFTYLPMRLTDLGSQDDLDQSLRIDLGDLGELLPQELDLVASAGKFGTRPVILYRTYRSDDLTAPLMGPISLEVTNIGFSREGASLEARAASLNVNRTGLLYRLDQFPMLRGFL